MKRYARLLACSALLLSAGLASAQPGFPSRPVTLVVPTSAGGVTDVIARSVAQQLAAHWGQPVVVENRPGANQIIGAQAVAQAPADGHTLLLSDSSTFVINPHLYRKLPYDPLRDFSPIAPIGTASPVIGISSSLDANTLAEFIALGRANPDLLKYGSMGNGSYAHIATEELKRMAGVEILHVPYKGAAPAITDLLAGNISMMLVNASGLEQHANSGKVKILAAATAERLGQYPELPTVAESGVPGFEANTWFGLVGPANLPADVVRKINDDVNTILRSEEFQRTALQPRGIHAAPMSPEDFQAMIATELALWGDRVKASGATLD